MSYFSWDSSKHPARYKVKEVQSKDIRDWKQLSQALRILKVRSTEEGNIIDWTKVMQVKVTKNQLTKLHVKFSHLSESFDTINITGSCRHVQVGLHFPGEAYPLGPPRISEGKFQDLMSLCEGLTPVISHPDHVAFYKHLPHWKSCTILQVVSVGETWLLFLYWNEH